MENLDFDGLLNQRRKCNEGDRRYTGVGNNAE